MKILRETWGSNTLIPLYDNEDSVCGIIYNETPYYFQKNLQGDIISLVNKNADIVARYTYDAWGVCTITQDTSGGVATVNPFRYRGYYFDSEIGMYYLKSRYYNPSVGRFLNADSKLDTNSGLMSYELYCYCGNSPVCRLDTLGCSWLSIIAIVIVVVVVAVAASHVINAVTAISQANYNKSNDEKGIVFDQHDVDMKFGGKKFADNGCGAAATHNAIILAGGSSSLAEVVEFMQAHDLTLGYCGVYFTNIQLYLKRKGYPNNICFINLKNNIDKKIKNSKRKIAILAYKHSTGGHYVAIKYDTSTKVFTIHNPEKITHSVDSWLEEGKTGPYTPLCLITI